MAKIGPVLSPVDYDAWQRGYCPPSEHALIDELSFRGARVITASISKDFAYWLVVRGDMPRSVRQVVCRSLMEQMDFETEEREAEASLAEFEKNGGVSLDELKEEVDTPQTQADDAKGNHSSQSQLDQTVDVK